MKKFKYLLVLGYIILLSGWVAGQEFKAGAALRVITPEPLLPVSGGVGIPKPVTEKKGELFVFWKLILSCGGDFFCCKFYSK